MSGDQKAGARKRKKDVSARVKAKRFQDFELKSAAVGESEAKVNAGWVEYYTEVFGDESTVAEVQSALAKDPRDSIECIVFEATGFNHAITQKLFKKEDAPVEVIQDASCRALLIKPVVLRLDVTLKEALDREAALGRCILNSSLGPVFAIRELFAHDAGVPSSSQGVFVDTCADGATKLAALQSEVALCTLPPGRNVPLFDTPSTVWIRTLADIEGPVQAQRVLCRLPSTRDAAFTSHKAWRKWRVSHAREVRAAQVRLIMESVELLMRQGLILIYTQSLNPIENEQLVKDIIQLSDGGLQLEHLKNPLKASFKLKDDVTDDHHGHYARVHPNSLEANGRGFFYCILRKVRDIVEWHERPSSADATLAKDYLIQTGQYIQPGARPKPVEFEEEEINQKFVWLRNQHTLLLATKAAEGYGREVVHPVRYGALVTERDDGDNLVVNDDIASILPAILGVTLELRGEEAERVWEQSRNERTIPFKADALPCESITVIRLSLSATDKHGEDQQKRRLSTAARRKLKKSSDPALSSTTAGKSVRSSGDCFLVVKPDHERQTAQVLNTERWLEACADSLFSA